MSNYEMRYFANEVEMAAVAARDWLDILPRPPEQQLAAVSGGRMGQTLLTALFEQARKWNVSMRNVHFFWSDERCVPPDNAESNFRTAKVLLLEPLNITSDKIHRIRGEAEPDIAAAAASVEINRLAPKNEAGVPIFDLIFLGMGEDGHVASLFPYAPPSVAEAQTAYVPVLDSPKPPKHRITLSYATIAAAKNVWVLVAGKGKERAFRDALNGDGNTPFRRVLESRRKTQIYSNIPAKPRP